MNKTILSLLTLFFVFGCSSDDLNVDGNVAGLEQSKEMQLILSSETSSLNGEWFFVGYEQANTIDVSKSLVPEENAYVIFDREAKDYKASGKSFVNDFLFEVSFEDNDLSFARGISTLMAGSDDMMEKESKFIESLEESSTYEVREKVLLVSIERDKMIFVKK